MLLNFFAWCWTSGGRVVLARVVGIRPNAPVWIDLGDCFMLCPQLPEPSGTRPHKAEIRGPTFVCELTPESQGT